MADDLLSKYMEKINHDMPKFPIKLKDISSYASWKEINADPYSSACFRYAEAWGVLMEEAMERGEPLTNKIAIATSHTADIEGITGAMYGFGKAILYNCWEYGDQLKEILGD